jgi:Acyl-CoA reductase (LuxC)
MTLDQRLSAFIALGHRLNAFLLPDAAAELTDLTRRAAVHNSWFDEPNMRAALTGIAQMLRPEELTQWLSAYSTASLEPVTPRRVGVVMAGNIPLVGFHDMLCVLISGHRLNAKLASTDPLLPRWLADRLLKIEPAFADYIRFVDLVKDADAVIATGSDNTARYFDYYFARKPHLIRRNRTSRAVLSGYETAEELAALGEDIFRYYGLGCRNVANLLVPPDYDFRPLLDALQPWQTVLGHNKYYNNYEYQRSLLLVNRAPHLDTGYLLVREDPAPVSPIAVLYYQTYDGKAELDAQLAAQAEKTQVVVSASGWLKGSLPFGRAQYPHLWDYADGVDTLRFLTTETAQAADPVETGIN